MELDEGDSIRGTLGTFEHKSAPEYIAQSYVCGEGECDFKITVNGIAHYIQPNLSIALRQTKRALQNLVLTYGKKFESWSNQWIWIDAICIHQSNVAEREMQIRFMGHIYRAATMTFISFGKWTESQRLLAGFFQWRVDDAKIWLQGQKNCHSTDRDGALIVDSARTQQTSLEWPSELQADFDMSGEDARAINDGLMSPLGEKFGNVEPYSQALHYNHPFWQACMELFEADWFSRLWTFQELWLSRHPYVTLHTLVPWDELALLLENINRLVINLDGRSTAVKNDNFTRFSDQYVSLRYHTHDRITNDIWILLAITATKRARLPKDHVFAILSLTNADTQRLIDVDYSKTDARVFQDTLQVAIRMMSPTIASWALSLHWERFAHVPSTTSNLPSWVPDLNNETNACIPYGHTLGHSKAVSGAFDDSAHLRVSLSPENGLIFLNVLEVDVVSMPVEPLSVSDSFHEANDGLLSLALMAWIKSLYNTMTSSEDDLPALKERLMNFFAATARIRKEQITGLCLLMEASQLTEDLTFDEVVLHMRQGLHPRHGLHWEPFEIANRDHKPLMESLYSVTRILWTALASDGSTYLLTTTGGRIGCSPKPVSPGDKVCIVPGASIFTSFLPRRLATSLALRSMA